MKTDTIDRADIDKFMQDLGFRWSFAKLMWLYGDSQVDQNAAQLFYVSSKEYEDE